MRRKKFIKIAGLIGLGGFNGASAMAHDFSGQNLMSNNAENSTTLLADDNLSMIGPYGEWAAGLNGNQLPSFSFRRKEWSDVNAWREKARQRVVDRLAIPDLGGVPDVKIKKQYTYDGLHVEELTWQLPYGRPTEAILLKPKNAKGRLPAILAFHDHGGNKYFGRRKITRTSDDQHPMMVTHQEHYYENRAWANDIAKKGYVVLVSDAFAFASRRVMIGDVPERIRQRLQDPEDHDQEKIQSYNTWAAEHEHIMAKSLFSAGTTWPGVFFAEDQKALDVLCARKDVDTSRIGCGGLSGGGLRTVMMGGLDPRIKCAVCVGFMTTWKDFIMNKSFIHTWMAYAPLLPNELDFPEILGLRTPLPTLVLNDEDDSLYTLPEMKNADNILRELYQKAKATDRYKCSYYPGPHKFDLKMQGEAFEWFDKWLRA